ncbi:MAG: hypothetical protein K8S27_00305 [Candidatus Omnitrophica bacterium]|nr:hypothetical protein [Candidatus Omnitrophota bacterium]
MVADKKKIHELGELLRTAGKERTEFVPREHWADRVMKDVRQISLEERKHAQHFFEVFVDYIDSISMAFWRFVPASAMALLLFGILYLFYNPIDDTLSQVWSSQHDAFLWIELLGI